jgi:methyl coenzyme M reductase subunit D
MIIRTRLRAELFVIAGKFTMLIVDEYNRNENLLYLCDESVVCSFKVARGNFYDSPIMTNESIII